MTRRSTTAPCFSPPCLSDPLPLIPASPSPVFHVHDLTLRYDPSRPNQYSVMTTTSHPTPQNNQMCDAPYTTAEEDPFNIQPYLLEETKTLKPRRSSMLIKWVSEQQDHSSPDLQTENLPGPEPFFASSPSVATSSNPYLAYPDLGRVHECDQDNATNDAASIISYDLVEDDDIPENRFTQVHEDPVTPIPPRTHKAHRNSLTPSFRTINLGFRSNSVNPPSSPSSPNMELASRAFARLSFFPRTPRSSTAPSALAEPATPPQHTRSASASTLGFSTSQANQPSLKSPPKWRPSVLGHFNNSSVSQASRCSDTHYPPSRPSVSSGETYATSSSASQTATTVESYIPSTPSRLSLLESIRLRTSSKSPRSASISTFSLASTSSMQSPTHTAPTLPELPFISASYSKSSTLTRIPFGVLYDQNIEEAHDDESDLEPPPTYRFNKHPTTKPSIPRVSSGTLSRVKFSSLNSRKKKKKLLISGIGVSETRKFEGIKRWCESFGEIRSISRLPNGDLQVDFRDPEVADTVCRVRAKVFIAGVGSVQLSWSTGNKR